MKTGDVLRKAAEYLDKAGLAKCELVNDKTGAVCLNGAINKVETGDPERWGSIHMFTDGLFNPCERNWSGASWNNRRERTKQEVVDFLIGAAVVADLEGK